MPLRIVSLVPSKTELLYDLGLRDEVVGITKFCVHPDEWYKSKARVGGTKTADIEKIKSLAPDLIIANKEENVKEQVEALSGIAQVYVSDIKNLADALEMIKHVGKLVNKETEANTLVKNIVAGFEQLKRFIHSINTQVSHSSNQPLNYSTNQPVKLSTSQLSNLSTMQLSNQSTPQPNNQSTYQTINLSTYHPPNTAYLIWKDPYMAAGGDTFIHDMLQRCGFNNIFKDNSRYPQITIEQLKPLTSQPINHSTIQLLLLSSEPFPFKQKHIDELQQQLAGTKILLVDGEMFSWYGSRLVHAPTYFIQLLQQINHLF